MMGAPSLGRHGHLSMRAVPHRAAAAPSAQRWGETISQARDMPAEWSVCLGEPALKIVGMDHLCNYKKLDTNGNIVFNSEENMTNILVLTECSIFGISLSGTICFQKKLDFLPMTCAALPVLGSSSSEKGRAFLVTGSTGPLVCTGERLNREQSLGRQGEQAARQDTAVECNCVVD